ncbi:MAG: serine acetyltransferase [Candidatus Eremiobacteraeota bacterium]|nr:serine acetyltransferase [Candidatus Eremiobacteraeota bacterium]MCW5869732.1 serine acetyltransferase [Candidatus Eremiobacteraeota bacterium]
MSARLSGAREALLRSYQESTAGQRIDGQPVASVSECLAILRLCQEALFPGYFGHRDVTSENLNGLLGGTLETLQRKLQDQVGLCGGSNEVSWAFVESLPAIRAQLLLDAQAALDGDPAATSIDEVLLAYPGFLAITVYRLAHRLLQLGMPLLARILSEWAHSQTGADIHPGAQIGDSFFLDHGTGVVIGATSVLGRRVRLYQGVTLGALSLSRDASGKVAGGSKRHPTLEDSVTVYANAVILGGTTVVGEGCVIGGGVFLTRSVPAGHRVILDPPPLRIQGPKPATPEGEVLVCPIDFEI